MGETTRISFFIGGVIGKETWYRQTGTEFIISFEYDNLPPPQVFHFPIEIKDVVWG